MQELVQFAVDVAKSSGASYADARIVSTRNQEIEVSNAEVKKTEEILDSGIGIRVIVSGAWGFASTSQLEKEAIKNTVLKAIKIAKASRLVTKKPAELAEEEPHKDEWTSPYKQDPFAVSISDKINYMLEVDKRIRSVKGITFSKVTMSFLRQEKYFASSEGALIKQTKTRSGAGMIAGAFKDGEYQYRSYPSSFGGQFALKGYELIEEIDMLSYAEKIAEEAVALLSAERCPSGEMDIILDSSQLALQIHESIGHPVELDRVLGTEANFAGTSFVTLDKLNNFQYGSPIMNIVADARQEHGLSLGCFAYDDEGVPAQCIYIVKEGQFTGYLSSRETAKQIGLSKSGGAMRATSWNRIPLIRMTQISLLPGEWELEALIQDTKEGIFMTTNKSFSIDDKRLNFQFGCEIGWLIKDGKKVKMLKNPTYAGITPQFWNSLDAICNKNHWILWGIPHCGKGQPMQLMEVSHGAAPSRFRKIKVGVG